MKRTSLYFLFAVLLAVQCGSDKVNNPPQPLPANDAKITGTWSFSLPYNADTTFYIVLEFDSSFSYGINVNINHTDTMHREQGTWQVVTDSATQIDTVWMNREKCRQINLTTHTFDSIDCGIYLAGIKVNISQSASNKTQWIIPLVPRNTITFA